MRALRAIGIVMSTLVLACSTVGESRAEQRWEFTAEMLEADIRIGDADMARRHLADLKAMSDAMAGTHDASERLREYRAYAKAVDELSDSSL